MQVGLATWANEHEGFEVLELSDPQHITRVIEFCAVRGVIMCHSLNIADPDQIASDLRRVQPHLSIMCPVEGGSQPTEVLTWALVQIARAREYSVFQGAAGGVSKLRNEELFVGRHFDCEVIILCVRWYLRYRLSLRDLVEMMAERGLHLVQNAGPGANPP
jgi:hypothetical protein